MSDNTPKVIAAVACAVVVVLVVVLSVVLTQNNGDGNNCATVGIKKGEEIRNGNDYIGLVFTQCPSQAAFDAFTAAASRWSSIIVENRITPLSIPGKVDSDEICFEGFPENTVTFNNGVEADHLLIFAENTDIDGEGGILAAAGFCNAFDKGDRAGDAFPFPLFGTMLFDNADLRALEADGTILEVITHEMGHVLGIGTIWPFIRADNGEFVEEVQESIDDSFLTTPVFDVNGNFAQNDFNNIQQPHFIGQLASDEFTTLGGDAADGVPVEDGSGQGFSIRDGEGQGSIDGHWDIDFFDQELMVFAIDPRVQEHPLSRVSIQSLADIGYGVDPEKAEDFSLPGALRKANLRSDADPSVVHSLKGDIVLPKGKLLHGDALLDSIKQKQMKKGGLSTQP